MKGLKTLLTALRGRPRLLGGLVIGALGLLGLGVGVAWGSWESVCRDCPSIAQIYTYQPKQATRVLDHDGKLIAELGLERRTPVSIAELPPYVPKAFVAVEDRRFFHHHGFDWIRTASALFGNVVHGHIFSGFTGGGSTITQQLARNMFKQDIGFKQRYTRKLRELKVAFELEDVYSKNQILEAYLNQINFGHGWWGIQTASERYFGKPASAMDPAEVALLVALAKGPAYYSPFRHPERALARRNLVIGVMADQGVISDAQAAKYRQEPLPDHPYGTDEGQLAPYFVEWVRDQLDERFGSDLYSRGFRVYTTLDLEMQKRAQEAMRDGWKRVEKDPRFHHPTYDSVMAEKDRKEQGEASYLQGMFIALDPATGEIRSLIGGRDFTDSKFNRAVQAHRQPGSSFKPILYSAAIASGIPASHVIYDAPLMLDQGNGQIYSPSNSDGEFHGPMTLREALKRSINVVAVKLGLEVGLETVVQYAHRMGLTTQVPPYPSIAIGSADVVPLQMAGVYTAFANGGVHAEPFGILRVEDAEGRVLWQERPERRPVLDSMTTYIIRDMMRGVVDHGTGYAVRDPDRGNLPYSIPVAGKTGTTNDYTDAWFIGTTPNLLAAVWMGFDRPQTIFHGAEGGALSGPVWGQFARSVYFGSGEDEPPLLPKPTEQDWPMPAGLITRQVDSETGKLATPLCAADSAYTEIFIPGTEPTEGCTGHEPGLFGGMLGLPLDSLRDTTRIKPKVNPKFKF